MAGEGHTYPSLHPPGTHWATDAAWEILDALRPGRLELAERSLIAGMIAGRLMRERDEATRRAIMGVGDGR